MATTTAHETTEDLHRAWRLLHRPCWPETFEATMEDPVRSRLVQMYAHHLALAAALGPCVSSHAGYPPRVLDRRNQTATPTLCRSSPTVVDRKRAASGERDDD